ncbi:unnamed protein product [Callosobruchus maculatus]|uniref:Uncharacterized protein n=1 Tax=Callosobruchus maculatus TaxID=64391 RepID=A0A653BST3_CALMS|nr:unnamed protein product [Callosobruchus maculatus]
MIMVGISQRAFSRERNNKKVVHSQGRQLIYNVYEFMKREKDTGN